MTNVYSPDMKALRMEVLNPHLLPTETVLVNKDMI